MAHCLCRTEVNIGSPDSNGTVALGKGLSALTNLQFLDLSRNAMGYRGSTGILGLAQGLAVLTNLQSLDLSENAIGLRDSNGTIALAQGLFHLTNLQSLDLSANFIGSPDSNGTVALGKGLSHLTSLQSLNLLGNEIDSTDSNGTVALAQGLAVLTNLQLLDLSENAIGLRDSNGTVALGKGLSHLTSLQSLNLLGNEIDSTDSNGTVALAQGLAVLTNLQFLDLSQNEIGRTDSNGVLALAQGLSHLFRLKSLDLSGDLINPNYIGSTGPEGPTALLKALESLPHFDFENFQGLNQINNITWINSSQTLQKVRFSFLINACQNSRCFGGGISPVSTPSITSAAKTFAVPRAFIEGPSNGRLPIIDPIDSRAVVVYEEPISQLSMLSDLGTSIVIGATLAALPEALGDSLHLSGLISERNAFHIKIATNAALVFATGSWAATGAAYLTTKTLQYAGVSESKARIGGNTAAFLVNTGLSLTTTKAAAVAVNYLAGRAGLWAEKGLMRRMFQKKQRVAM